MKKFLLTLLFAVPMAHAQYVTAAKFGQVVTIPSGTWVRYGSVADNLWDPPKYYSAAKTYTVGAGEFTSNPDTNAAASTFVIQVYTLPMPQTITAAGAKLTIPASVPQAPSSSSGSITGGLAPAAQVNYTVNLNADQSFNSGTCSVTAAK